MEKLYTNRQVLLDEVKQYLAERVTSWSVFKLCSVSFKPTSEAIVKVCLVIREETCEGDTHIRRFTVDILPNGNVEGDDDSEPFFEVPIQDWARRILRAT
jgi:predicted nucleotidyltransferase